MIFRFFRKDNAPDAIAVTFGRIVDASRAPLLYTDFGVPDTVEGRFEALSFHMILTLRRLRELPPPADEFGQELVDATFKWLDNSLRDMGVGDLAVPKRMKTLVEAFYGRAHAYDAALDADDRGGLVEALRRNVTGEEEPAGKLADYLLESCARLSAQDFNALIAQGPAFAAPAAPAQ